MLCRSYGATCAHTPMIDAGGFARAESYRNEFPMKDHEPRDHPVVAQLGGSKLLDVVAAAKLASIHSDAVELNVGCPQRCAKKGKYGAFLMEQPVTLIELVEGMVGAVPPHVAVLVKMRIFEDEDRTVALARCLEAAGATVLTVHGRTKEKGGGKGQKGPACWDTIKAVKNALGIPVVSNGNINNLAEVEQCLQYTGCDAVMSGCGLLANPALFSGLEIDKAELCLKYLDFARRYPPKGYQPVVKHLFNILGSDTLKERTDVRDIINNYRAKQEQEEELRNALESMRQCPLDPPEGSATPKQMEAQQNQLARVASLQNSFLGKKRKREPSDAEGDDNDP